MYLYETKQPNKNKMETIKTNIWNLEVGDIITFTNSVNSKREMKVLRVEEKSWYTKSRRSWGTLQEYSKYPDFKIKKANNQTKNKRYECNTTNYN